MKSILLLTVFVFLIVPCSCGFGQNSDYKIEVGRQIQPFLAPINLSPQLGSEYTLLPGLSLEHPVDGTDLGFVFGIAADPATGVINNAIMDGLPDKIGTDFSELFGAGNSSDIVARECLESLGFDQKSQMYRLRLTITVEATGTELLWDSLDQDLLDPTDIDRDGNFEEPDGIFDTGDGVLDQPFPLDPVGIKLLFDLNPDGKPTDPVPAPAASQGLFLGANAGGQPMQFDSSPIYIVEDPIWELRNFQGELADINRDGVPDGPFVIDCSLNQFGCNGPFGSGWNGSFGIGLLSDEDVRTVDLLSGSVKSNTLILEFFSGTDAEFCFDQVLCGDVNRDGIVDLLDIQPFVDLISTGTFQAEGDINRDGIVDLFDVTPFVEKLTSG